MGGAANRNSLMLTGAALGLAAVLLSGLPPLLAGIGAALIFICSLPVLDQLQWRLHNTPARIATGGLILLALYGILG
jgi:hypothetical protein